jgi:Cdc6-like AAA superfamily ATPase
MGQNRLVYEPYSRDEVSEILTSRIKDIRGVFDQKSLGLIATKISNYSGDIRRSLQITKRAVEIC